MNYLHFTPTEAETRAKEINALSEAFKSGSFPCNPIPFAQAIADGVKLHGTAWIKTDEAKSILYVLIGQSYNQLFTVDAIDEYGRLANIKWQTG